MKRRSVPDLRSEAGREHEERLLRFIAPAYKARFSEILKKVAAGRPPGSAAGGGRYQINHFAWWDGRFATDVADLDQGELEARLRAAGAPSTCWVISEEAEIDGSELPVAEALTRMWAPVEASIASFIPGRLAYYHDNDDRSYLILERD